MARTVDWALRRVTPKSARWTRGEIYAGPYHVHSAELPWKDNERDVSCIVEGTYRLVPHPDNEEKIRLLDVPDRELINIEIFNDPLEESEGCIAPGMEYDEEQVLHSGAAMDFLLKEARSIWDRGDEIRLHVVWANEQRKEDMSLLNTIENHTSFAKMFVNRFLPSADKAEADAAIDILARSIKATIDIETADFADLAKQVAALGPEVDGAIQSVGPEAHKLWTEIVGRLHRHRKTQ